MSDLPVVEFNGKKYSASELDKQCTDCKSNLFFNWDHDAEFCAVCNVWKEKGCSKPHCIFCAQRPKKPLDAKYDGTFAKQIMESKTIEVD